MQLWGPLTITAPVCCACVRAPQVPDVNGILDRLLFFLGYEKDYVTAETLVQVGGRRVSTQRRGHLSQQPGMESTGCRPLHLGWLVGVHEPQGTSLFRTAPLH